MDAVSDTASDLPHMLPRPKTFAAAADALGISNDSQVGGQSVRPAHCSVRRPPICETMRESCEWSGAPASGLIRIMDNTCCMKF